MVQSFHRKNRNRKKNNCSTVVLSVSMFHHPNLDEVADVVVGGCSKCLTGRLREEAVVGAGEGDGAQGAAQAAFFSVVLIIWQSEQEEGTVEKGPRSKRDATAKKMIGRWYVAS